MDPLPLPRHALWRAGLAVLMLGLWMIPSRASEDVPAQKLGRFPTLLPKAFQSNPSLEMTVFTEVTDYGKQLPDVSPQQPMYYIARCAGFKPMGMAIAGEHPPMPEEFRNYMLKALGDRGFRPAVGEATPPELVLIYYWGSHSYDPEWAQHFKLAAREAALDRAALVGGADLANRVARIMKYGAGPTDRSVDIQYLLDQAGQEIYYVSVSAFSFADLMHGKHRLAWRTTMTVTSNGVAMKTAMPPLVATAGDYFGRPTPEPVAIRRRVHDGTVSIGELEVIETIAPQTEPPSD